MAGRRSVWSDPRVIEASRQFVTATDEVWRLQRGDDTECRFFQTMVRGEPGLMQGSHQGTYVCAPSGRLLARINSLRADDVLRTIEEGWRRWQELGSADRVLADASRVRPEHRWEQSCPPDGLVLTSLNRDLPAIASQGGADRRWNRDHVWFDRAEAREWLGPTMALGEVHSLPRALVERLTRFHLVDNVRGQVGPFATEELALAEITTEVVKRDAAGVWLVIRGKTRADSDGVWKMGENDWRHFPQRPRGIETELLGTACFDPNAGAFRELNFVAVGQSWGAVGLNGRRETGVRFPLGFVFELVEADRVPTVAPAFIDVYEAPWVRRPAS